MKKLLTFLAACALNGCAFELGRFPVLSTKNVEISRVDLKKIGVNRDVRGVDGRLWFLFVPLGSTPTIENQIIAFCP